MDRPGVRREYPYRELQLGGPAVGGVQPAPLRRWTDATGLPGMRLEVDGPAGRFVLYGLHVPRPWYTPRAGYQASLPSTTGS